MSEDIKDVCRFFREEYGSDGNIQAIGHNHPTNDTLVIYTKNKSMTKYPKEYMGYKIKTKKIGVVRAN